MLFLFLSCLVALLVLILSQKYLNVLMTQRENGLCLQWTKEWKYRSL